MICGGFNKSSPQTLVIGMGANQLKEYFKSYASGILLGLILCSSAYIRDDVPFSLKQNWYLIIIFLPALIYFISSYSEYNEVSFKKDKFMKSIPFILGIGLSTFAIYTIWGLPEFLK